MSVKNYVHSIALNNEGCEYLECGELLSARNCFRDALQFMTAAIVEAQKETMDQPHILDNGERNSEFQWSVMPRVPLHVSTEAFFFQRGILIHRDDDDDDDEEAGPSPFELSEESSMIVYNLGLSFHLIAMSVNKATLLHEAMSFYQIAEAIRARRPQSCLPELIDLAIYNNMGHIEFELVNYERARAYFQMLKTSLIAFSQNGLVEYISDQDSQGFVLNASMQEVTLAAAA